MAEKITRRDFINKAVSVFIAVVLWFFVAYAENPEKELWFKDIPITFAGEGALSDLQLAKVDGSEDSVSVKVKGSRSAIVALSSSDIVATVDLSAVKEAKAYILPVVIKFPVDGLVLSDKKPYSVSVVVEKVITKEFPLEIELEGDAGAGTGVLECSCDVESIKLTGGESLINKVDAVVAKGNIGGITEDKTIASKIHIKGQDGTLYTDDNIRMSKSYVDVFVKFGAESIVPITAVFDDQSQGKVKNVRVNPSNVKISGSAEKIKDIKEIKTVPITVSGKNNTEKLSAELIFPEGVKNIDGINSVEIELEVVKENIADGE